MTVDSADQLPVSPITNKSVTRKKGERTLCLVDLTADNKTAQTRKTVINK